MEADTGTKVLFMAKVIFGTYLLFSGGWALATKAFAWSALTLLVLGALLLGLAWFDPQRDAITGVKASKKTNERDTGRK